MIGCGNIDISRAESFRPRSKEIKKAGWLAPLMVRIKYNFIAGRGRNGPCISETFLLNYFPHRLVVKTYREEDDRCQRFLKEKLQQLPPIPLPPFLRNNKEIPYLGDYPAAPDEPGKSSVFQPKVSAAPTEGAAALAGKGIDIGFFEES